MIYPEFDQPEGPKTPNDAVYADRAAELRQQDGTIGAEPDQCEGNTEDMTSAHDPLADIDTSGIGNGDDETPDDHTVPDDADPAGEAAAEAADEPPDTTAVAERVSALALDATTEPAAAHAESTEAAETETAEPAAREVYAEPEPATDIPTENAPAGGEFGDTAITKEEVVEKFKQWERGEPVESSSTPVARVEVSDKELAAISGFNHTFGDVNPAAVREGITDKEARHQTHLTKLQSKVISDIGDRFLAAVQADADRNSLGPLDTSQYAIRVGYVNPEYALAPHTDPHCYPAVCYVLSIGEAGATVFTHGPVQQDDVTGGRGNVVTAEALQAMTPDTHTTVTHGTGVVSRFLANHDIHAMPLIPGFRLFYSVDIDLRQHDEQPR
jgi:hypothetical protein